MTVTTNAQWFEWDCSVLGRRDNFLHCSAGAVRRRDRHDFRKSQEWHIRDFGHLPIVRLPSCVIPRSAISNVCFRKRAWYARHNHERAEKVAFLRRRFATLDHAASFLAHFRLCCRDGSLRIELQRHRSRRGNNDLPRLCFRRLPIGEQRWRGALFRQRFCEPRNRKLSSLKRSSLALIS
jgi:hypothetical protein